MKRLALMFSKILFAAVIAAAGTQSFANDIETVRMDLGTPFEYSDGLWVHNFVFDVRRTSNFAELVGEAAAGYAGGLAGERIPVQGSCIERRGWYCRAYLGNGVEFRYMEDGQYTATDAGGSRVSGTAEISFYVRNRLNTPFNMGGLVTFVDGGDNSGIPGSGGNNSSSGVNTGTTVTYYSITNPGNGQSTTATLPDNIFAGTYWQWRNAAGDSDWSALASDDPDAAAQGRTLTIQSENSYQYRISWESGGTRKFASTFVTSNSDGNDNGTASPTLDGNDNRTDSTTLDCGNLHSGDCRVLSLLYDHWNLSRIGWGVGNEAGQWLGLTVQAFPGAQGDRVTELDLSFSQLTGEIPPELGQLTNLESLDLDGNELTGSIPAELGQLTSLVDLNLYINQLTGEIPAELGQLTSLVDLNLDNNQLTGEIPAELGQLTSLVILNLHSNQLTGEIPAELGQLENLRFLRLSGNQLTGEIPAELGQLTNLESLVLDGNELTGSIPAELGQLENLTSLSLGGNHLTGEIPAELGQLANLGTLWLHNNQLTGEIPEVVRELCDNEGVSCIFSGNSLME